MKKETAEQRLNALLGITEKIEEVKQKVAVQKGNLRGIDDSQIEHYRAIQGLIYYLIAPELYTHKKCKECNEDFLVSRLHVAFCSYDCMRKSLRKLGLRWEKGDYPETLALDPQVYDGNEPLWVRNLPMLQKCLEDLISRTSTESQSTSASTSPEDKSSPPPILGILAKLSSSPPPTTT